jgi:hypothetical protein
MIRLTVFAGAMVMCPTTGCRPGPAPTPNVARRPIGKYRARPWSRRSPSALTSELLHGDVADLEALLRHVLGDGPQRLTGATQSPYPLDGLLLLRVIDQFAAPAQLVAERRRSPEVAPAVALVFLDLLDALPGTVALSLS